MVHKENIQQLMEPKLIVWRSAITRLEIVATKLYCTEECLIQNRLLLGSPHNHLYWLNMEPFESNSTNGKWEVKVPGSRNKSAFWGDGMEFGGKNEIKCPLFNHVDGNNDAL